jgi:N-acetylneuraminic acid mutarotase
MPLKYPNRLKSLRRAVSQVLETLEGRRLFHGEFGIKINFGPEGVDAPDGYVADDGRAFADRGNGLQFGWDSDNFNGRVRRVAGASLEYKTLNYMQQGGDRSWEIVVPENGLYSVRVVAGDGQYIGGRMRIAVEGQITVSDRITEENPYVEGTAIIDVTDGRITLTNASKALQNKIAFVEITSAHGSEVNVKVARPTATADTPAVARFTRMGDLSESLVVQYALAGSAQAGEHYVPLAGSVTIPAGRSWAEVDVTALDGQAGERSLLMSVSEDEAYRVGQSAAADLVVQSIGIAPESVGTRINFQPSTSVVPEYYKADTGAVYGTRGNGLTYGWSSNNTANARDRNNLIGDGRYDSFNHMQKDGTRSWEMAVPNGTYTVRVVAGEASYYDSVFRINVEGKLTVSGTPTSASRFVEGTSTVTVTDGRLTISNASGASNNKIAFVEIMPGSQPFPVVSIGKPVASAAEGSSSPAKVRFARTGDLSQSLTVGYAVGGTATAGSDYERLSGTVTIPAGAAFADINIVPIDDTLAETAETVLVAINPGQQYSPVLQQTVSISLTDNDTVASNTINWANTTGPATTLTESLSVVVNGRWYLFGGFNSGFQPQKTSYAFDPQTNKYTQIADMPEALTHVSAQAYGNKVYFVGGYVGKTSGGQTFGSAKTWVYDTAANTWSQGVNLPEARAGGGSAVIGNYLYYYGGETLNRASTSNKTWRLDLTNPSATWQVRANMPEGRNHLSSVAYNGLIYAFGGQTGYDDNLVAKTDVWSYDPAADAWTRRASLPGPRSHVVNSYVVTGGKLYVFGGESAHKATLSSTIVYDFANNSWSSATPLPRARMSACVALLGDKIYVVGGYNGSIQTQAWVGRFV